MNPARYFRSTASGAVACSIDDIHAEALLTSGYTEVQVVPLGAAVFDGLPEVTPVEGGYRVDGVFYLLNRPVEEYEEDAAESLRDHLRQKAIAAHLREHPPVDEAWAKALAEPVLSTLAKYSIYLTTEQTRGILDETTRHLVTLGYSKGGAA